MPDKKAQDEVVVLLHEVEVGPYKVKPWSFGQFMKIYPAVISQLIPPLREAGMTPDNFEEILSVKSPEIIGAALPAFVPLIAITLNIAEEIVEGMDFDQAAALGLTIISQNVGRIKNSLPLIMAQFKAMTRAA